MLRVFSDLHVFDGSSRIESLRQLDPLTHDVDALLINGDSCDTQVGATADQIEELRAYLAGRAPRVTFVTGNHDPDISEVHELLLGDGRIWATHGDVLYANATPWSRLLPELERRIATARSQRPQVPLDRIESRLEIFRQISRRLPSEDDIRRRDLRSRLVRLLRDVGSVRRVRAILRAWQTAPDLAAALARQRPTAQVVVCGHIHRPSISRRGALTIINTGAFSGPFAPWCVDVMADEVRVRSVERRRGAFHTGEMVATIPLVAARAAASLAA